MTALAMLWSGFGLAAASSPDDTSTIVTQVTSAVQDYVNAFGGHGSILAIDATTGELSENQLSGTSTSLEICKFFVVAHMNFSNASGKDVIGNFILRKTGDKMQVVDYSFGQDPSLLRLQHEDCEYWSTDIPELRRFTL
jgi:hypothetical protein